MKENKCLDCKKEFVSVGHSTICYDCTIQRLKQKKLRVKELKGGGSNET